MKTKRIKVHPDYPDLKDIAQCAKVIRQGGLVIFPTETVYGIAVDSSNEKAMKRLREVKQREEGKPFSILISQKELISNHTLSNNQIIYKLIDAFWPGPLTVVVPSREEGQTVGIRMPHNLIALKLVQESQCTIVAPSANIEGKTPPKTCDEALEDLDGLVDMAIDGGSSYIGKSSTVVDLVGDKPTILREGVITQENIDREVNKKTVLFVCTGNSCRSVMAEYYLKRVVGDRKDLDISSAGTSVFIQSTASAETMTVLGEMGADTSNHLSRPIGSIMLKKSDLIFVMTRTHRDQVLERVPEVEKRVYLLREFANIPADFSGSLDIPDPIGQSHTAYKECFAVIQEAVQKVVELL